jgi:hypothetical protein
VWNARLRLASLWLSQSAVFLGLLLAADLGINAWHIVAVELPAPDNLLAHLIREVSDR